MPPRRRPASTSLTPDDLASLTGAIAEGRRATVYLVEGTPSLNLPAGSSARVVSVSGTTVVVRPRGIDDELPYEADELRLSKNAPAPLPSARAPRKQQSSAGSRVVRESAALAASSAGGTTDAAPQQGVEEGSAASRRRDTVDGPSEPNIKRAAAPRSPGRRASGAAKPVTLILHGSADNRWSVALTRGGTKPPRSRPVTPESVETAVRALGDTSAVDAVTSLVNAARDEARRRVEELSRELDAARRELAALDGAEPPASPTSE